jgi:hypothetical protein
MTEFEVEVLKLLQAILDQMEKIAASLPADMGEI